MKSNLVSNLKVGDWVVTTCRGVWQITHEIELSSWELTLTGEARLWTPKEGDWCWFYDNKSYPQLKQYNCLEPIGQCYVSKQGMMSSKIEPFIGELPSCLKEPRDTTYEVSLEKPEYNVDNELCLCKQHIISLEQRIAELESQLINLDKNLSDLSLELYDKLMIILQS